MGHSTRVLTIEDEPLVRRLIVAYMADSGFEMLEAGDGLMGLELFRNERPDVVLCDLRLPGMDGLDVLSSITAESPETPVIVVSGAGRVSDAVQSLKGGAWDFVTKPIEDMAVLESAVRRAMERADLRRQNQNYQQHLESLNRKLTRALEQFEADHKAGRKIQLQLLPEDNRRFGQYEFSRRLYPSMYLSGDNVDYFAIDSRRVGFYIADVSGHGAASAFVTVMLRTLVRQFLAAWRHNKEPAIISPAQTLRSLDAHLRSQELEQHVTMFMGVIDREEDQMLCASGGHYPFPIMHDGREIRPLTARNFPVGLFPDAAFEEQQIPFPDSAAMLLVSDGVLEILPKGSAREKHMVLHGQMAEPDVTLEHITAELGLAEGTVLPDDVALLLVRRRNSHD